METQLTAAKRKELFTYLDNFFDMYNPDIIGINEVIYDEVLKKSYLLDYFKKRGYYTHFAPFSPVSKQHTIGSGLITKQKPMEVQEHTLGPDLPAKRRGFGNHDVKTIEAVMLVPGTKKEVRVVVTYLAHLIPLNWFVHQRHYQKLRELLRHRKYSEDFIMVGDFNEPKYHPNMLLLKKYYKRKTGTILTPTWRLHGKRLYLVRANYDNIMWSKDRCFELDQFDVLKDHPSDHAPLLAKFVLK